MSLVATTSDRQLDLGPYITHGLLSDIPVDVEGHGNQVKITCVEFHDNNLYVGTSAAEIIHFVSIPPDPTDLTASPSFIQASRRQVDFQESSSTGNGVEQILVLPTAGKACILCNGTLTFYSLPELSPAYSENTRVLRCSFVGGVDLDLVDDPSDESDIFIVCDETKIRLVQLGDKPKSAGRTIGQRGCVALQRRGTLACTADSRSYSLVEVAEQKAMPLFEVSPQNDQLESSAPAVPAAEKPLPAPPSSEASAAPPDDSAVDTESNSDQKIAPTEEETLHDPDPPRKRTKRLRPNIVSPTTSEFLLTTGTSADDEGVGIFINLDGDIIRGTLQFGTYPDTLLVDGAGIDITASQTSSQPKEAGYVLAVLSPKAKQDDRKIIEIQRWDLDPSDENPRFYLRPPDPAPDTTPTDAEYHLGLARPSSSTTLILPAVTDKLCLKRAKISSSRDQRASETNDMTEDDAAREQSEAQFITGIASLRAGMLLWDNNSIHWLLQTPLLLRLDNRLEKATSLAPKPNAWVVRSEAEAVLRELKDLEAQNELDFMTIKYVRQKASLLLFLDLLVQTSYGKTLTERDRQQTEDALINAETDPRVFLAVIPHLQNDVFGAKRLWLQGGLASVLDTYLQGNPHAEHPDESSATVSDIFPIARNFLVHWRKKKGFGSIADETDVFMSVDAALLHLLLILDKSTPRGPRQKSPIRSELNALVDGGVDCFEYALELCEQYQRLYVLSRVYQSKRQAAMVLQTWKRIVEGEYDAGGELMNEGEEAIKDYLRQRKRQLVEEYGTWLAQRNPSLGVQVFADPKSQTKFQPKEVVQLLREKAPNAVKSFLEHLVFGNNLPQYANDLIGYYLDSVTSELDASDQSKAALVRSYQVYKALTPPKPTYSQFAAQKGTDAEWWRSRLRLLQLLGGSHGAASQYDISSISSRVEGYREYLVPEMIILSGRQGRHDLAIQMLTHRLGDFDTAISYCVLGGSSTYSPLSGREQRDALPSHEAQVDLFRHLLSEFFKIEDAEDRTTQTSELLDRFSGWFDLDHVLTLVPETWSVEMLSGFLQSSIRRLVSDRNEAVVTRALVGSASMTASINLIEKIDSLGHAIEGAVEQAG